MASSPSPATAAAAAAAQQFLAEDHQHKDFPMDLNKQTYDKHSAVNLLSKSFGRQDQGLTLGASADFESHHHRHHQMLLQQSIYNNLGVTPLLLNNNVSKNGLFKEVCGGDFEQRMPPSDEDSGQSEDEGAEDFDDQEEDEEIQMRKKCRLDEDVEDEMSEKAIGEEAGEDGEVKDDDGVGQDQDQNQTTRETGDDVIIANTTNSSATSGRISSRPSSASAASAASLKSSGGGGGGENGSSSRPSSASPRGASPMLSNSNNGGSAGGGGGYHKQATILDIFKGRKMLNGLNNNNTQQQEVQNRENLFHPAFSASNPNASSRSSPLTAAALSAAASLNGARQVIKSEFEGGRFEHGRGGLGDQQRDQFGRSGSHHHHHRSGSLREGIRRSSRSPLHDAKGENLMTPPGGGGGGGALPQSSSASTLGNALLANLAAAFPGFPSSEGPSSCSSDIQRSLSNLLSQHNASAMSALAALHAGSQAAAPLNLSSGQASSLGPAQLAQLISQQQQAAAAATFLNASSGGAANASVPQLLLASGQIVQGVQGAQLLIPTSQGLVAQSILAIPLAQGSPPLFPPPPSPPTGAHAARGHLHESRGSPPSNRDLFGAHTISEHQKLINEGRNGIRSSKTSSSSGPSSNSNNIIPSSAPSLNNHSVNSHLHNNNHHQHLDQQQRTSSQQRTISDFSSGYHRFPAKLMSPSASSLRDDEMSEDEDESEDKFSDNDDPDQMVDGINLDEIKEFAKAFKLRRLSLGLTQTQVGQALSVTEGPAYSQSAICSALAWQLAQSNRTSATTTCTSSTTSTTELPQPASMFEKLDITPKSAQKIKPVLERWMKEAEERYKHGHQNLNDFVGMEPSKKRKRRTSFTPQALEILNTHFERNTHPSGNEITTLAHQLGYEREVIRIWFCNKRQALKNTVRMMSKGGSPI